MNGSATVGIGLVLLIVAFLVFVFNGNVASGIVLLALGVSFVAAGGRQRAGGRLGGRPAS
jgi:membrane-bound ClpP family serine protease